MTGVGVLSLFSLAYQLGSPAVRSQLRAPSCSMELRLNNYILPGPLQPLGNQARAPAPRAPRSSASEDPGLTPDGVVCAHPSQVLVKPRKLEDKTDGGLFVPTAESEKPKEGFVIAAGPGTVSAETGEMIECPVKEGDLVLLSDFSGEKIDYNGENHVCSSLCRRRASACIHACVYAFTYR